MTKASKTSERGSSPTSKCCSSDSESLSPSVRTNCIQNCRHPKSPQEGTRGRIPKEDLVGECLKVSSVSNQSYGHGSVLCDNRSCYLKQWGQEGSFRYLHPRHISRSMPGGPLSRGMFFFMQSQLLTAKKMDRSSSPRRQEELFFLVCERHWCKCCVNRGANNWPPVLFCPQWRARLRSNHR